MPRGIGVAVSTLAPAAIGMRRVRKVTVTHTQLQAADVTSTITLLSLAAKEAITAVTLRHSTAFGGGLLASYTLSVGIAGNLVKYLAAKDVFTAVVDTLSYVGVIASPLIESFANATTIQLTAIGVGANLSASLTGAVDVWVETIQLP